MQINQTFLKLKLLKELLKKSIQVRQTLLDECIDIGGTDSTILMRRFRMLDQLNQFESNIINKIYNFEITSFSEVIDGQRQIDCEIDLVTSRSA